jgi:Tfp pilus assembly protein PilW
MMLAEALIAIGVTALLMLTVCTFSVFTGRSFAALYNYVELDDDNRIAMDQITRDVRQANRVKSWATTSLVLEESDGSDLSFTCNAAQKTLVRTKNGVSNVLLKGCQRLAFDVRQRNAVAGTYDLYPVSTTPATAKVVNVSWSCSRFILGNMENTESVQTARIVIRKQGL